MDTGGKSDESRDPRSKLLAAAGPVFAQNGFERATLRDICSSAGVNVAAVSYYFGDKMGLYREVVDHIRREREERFPAPADSGDESKLVLWRLVRTMLSRMLYGGEKNWETQLLMREMNSPTPAFEELVNEFFRPLFERIKTTLTALMDREVPEHVIEQLALSTVGQCLYYRVGRGVVEILIPADRLEAEFDLDSLSQHVTAVILSATEHAKLLQEKDALSELVENEEEAIEQGET